MVLSWHSLCWRVSTARIVYAGGFPRHEFYTEGSVAYVVHCFLHHSPMLPEMTHIFVNCIWLTFKAPWESPIELEIHNTIWPKMIRVGQRCVLAWFSTSTISADKDITFCWKYALYCNWYCYHFIVWDRSEQWSFFGCDGIGWFFFRVNHWYQWIFDGFATLWPSPLTTFFTNWPLDSMVYQWFWGHSTIAI